jgi:hypothetical protein
VSDLGTLDSKLSGLLDSFAFWATVPREPYRVRVLPYDPANLMSSPWCKEREGQAGVVVKEYWSMCRVRFDDGAERTITYDSLERVRL